MGSDAPQNEQRSELRFDVSSRSFSPESGSGVIDDLAGVAACVTD
jgi:hypothetical protein